MNQIFDLSDEIYSIRHMTGQVRSVIVQRTFYLYIVVLSFIHPLLIRQSPLVVRSLSVTCPLNMRYTYAFYALLTSSPDEHPHRHRDNYHHRMNTG